MVTYGFYNSIDHDRVYDATQMSEIFDGIIENGVYRNVGKSFAVDNKDLIGFQVRVGTGRAWYNHTWTKNDAPLILNLPDPPTLDNYYRCDAIVLDIDTRVDVRENKITYVKGTEVANNPSPPYPELADGDHKQVPLAYIVRKGAETAINPANIQCVVGLDPCPFVTSPNQSIDLTLYVNQWKAAWEQWFSTNTDTWDADLAAAEAAINTSVDNVAQKETTAKNSINEYVAEFQVWIASQKSQFNGWMDKEERNFDIWFRNLQYVLDGDVAGHLQNEIDALGAGITTIEHGGTGNDQGYIQTGFKDEESTLGEFVTSEGMNTVASGKCAHAEGGGNYSHQHQDNHFESENLLRYSNPNDDEYIDLDVTDVEGGSSEYIRYSGPKTLFSTNYQHNITSFYVGKVLKNKTTGDILKTDIICIGEASKNKEEYAGHIVDPNSNVSFNNKTYKDYGFFGACYKSGYTDYWYVDGKNIVDLFEPVEFTIDLPYSNTNRTITGQAASFDIPFSSIRSCIIVENRTNKLKGGNEYNDFLQKFGSPEVTKDSDLNLQSFTINSDYSYSITYTNKNIRQNTYKIKFSTKYLHDYIDVRDALDDFYAKCIVNAGSSETTNYFWISNDKKQAGIYTPDDTLYTYGFDIGTEYTLEYYYSYTLDNTDEDVPLVWIPARDYIDIEGPGTKALGDFSHAEGYRTIANGNGAHAEGRNTSTDGNATHAEGQSTVAGSEFYHTYGDHAEGYETEAISSKTSTSVIVEDRGSGAHAEGYQTKAEAGGAHAEGNNSEATNYAAHAEGYNTKASGEASHAEGSGSQAKGHNSHAGAGGIAYLTSQFVHGCFGFGGDPGNLIETNKVYTLEDGAYNGLRAWVKSNVSLTVALYTGNGSSSTFEGGRLWVLFVTSENEVDMYLIKGEDGVYNLSIHPIYKKTNSGSEGTLTTPTKELVSPATTRIVIPGDAAYRQIQLIRLI